VRRVAVVAVAVAEQDVTNVVRIDVRGADALQRQRDARRAPGVHQDAALRRLDQPRVAPGESGNWPTAALVNAVDEAGASHHPRGAANPAPVTFKWDYNRDRLVNGTGNPSARGGTVATVLRGHTRRPRPVVRE
jgi:hypothetical protein